jgi:hypothetical protein
VSGVRTLDRKAAKPEQRALPAGASSWTAAKREVYADDQDAAAYRVAVTARTDRCGEQDATRSQWPPTSTPGS